jgi:hypothetical protein
LESESAGLKRKKEKIRKTNRKEKFVKQSKQRNKNSPGRDRHRFPFVAPLAYFFPSKDFRPGAFGGRGLA